MFYTSDKMIKAETEEYNIGKRHLANIMGQDPDLFEQEDIDVSIYRSLAGPHPFHTSREGWRFMSQFHHVPVPVCTRPIVPQFNCVPGPLCPGPNVD